MSTHPPTLRNKVRDKLARDEVVASMTARLIRGIEVAQIAATAGFDSLYVDLEHGPLTIDITGQICIAALAVGVTPFVRVPAIAPEFVGRVLDAGALGIIAPHIHWQHRRKNWFGWHGFRHLERALLPGICLNSVSRPILPRSLIQFWKAPR
jgi:2-keto-3-deoxy-L-rhamnonate aldolase RhmA